MAARLGRIGSLSSSGRPTRALRTRPVVGLVMGRNILLWNLLVAHLSDDPLRALICLAGLSTFTGANCPGRGVPRPLQPTALSAGRSFWPRGGLHGAALMGFM